MKYIKLFEELNIDEPKVGDWAICEAVSMSQYSVPLGIKNFLSITIGRIKNKNKRTDYNYGVYFENMPKDVEDGWGNPAAFMRNEIKFWSENKEDLEYIIQANKYNL